MSCFVLGDSIAVGVALVLHGCEHWAIKGKSAIEIARHAPIAHYDFVAVSAGSNPPGGGKKLTGALRALRDKLDTNRIVWIVPANGAGGTVASFANNFGDHFVYFTAGKDGVHPRSYWGLAWQVLIESGDHL